MSRQKINPVELRLKIGMQLKKARLEKGFTQEELGNELGVTRVVIGMYEKGRLRVSIQLLLQFCMVLEKPVQYFIDEPELPEKESVAPAYNLQDSIEFSLEMALRNYLRASGVNKDLSERVESLMLFIQNSLPER